MKQVIPFILKNLKRRRLRSWLTIIGIIVGVLAIVSLMSLSQSLKDTITSEFDKLGARKITINSRFNSYGSTNDQKGLTEDDVKVISRIPSINNVIGGVSATSSIEYNRINKYFSIKGYHTEDLEDMFYQDNVELLKGKYLGHEKSKEIIIGYDFYGNFEDVFEKRLDIGSILNIGNNNFKVVGITKDSGGRGNLDIYMSLDNVRVLTGSNDNVVDSIYAIAKEGEDVTLVAEKIISKLENYRGVEDFTTSTAAQTAEKREETLDVVSIVIIGIASISLLVGGIGIMNSMYTSVVERKKEIGVMMAIGAKRLDIMQLFLLEAGIIGLIGGILGALNGFLLAYLVSVVANAFDVSIGFAFNFQIVFIALGFSFAVGLLSGFWPAYKASRQEPVESLREE